MPQNLTDTATLYHHFESHRRISTDSRHIEPDSLFFALKGASFDGNRFAADALKKGAALAVVDNPQLVEEHPTLHDRLVVVPDVLEALQLLAREHRRRLGLPILAIAGSNGKTTTKELTASVLSEKFHLYATHGNLNNHIGVPLTLLAMEATTELGVVEMGASGCGEIRLLCEIAEPDFGILTNIGRSHLEGFGGPEGIRRGKGELFDFLAERGGKAFVPREDAVLQAMAAERPNLAVEHYSTTIAEGVVHQLEGDYNRLNIAAAMAIGRHFEVKEEQIRHAIASYVPQNHRSQRVVRGSNCLILDCYNANPSSMAASIDHFAREGAKGRRKMMILGDMLELGCWSEEEHRRILERACAVTDAKVWLVGPRFTATAEGIEGVRCFASQEELAEELKEHPVKESLVLIKGSHSIGLERCEELF